MSTMNLFRKLHREVARYYDSKERSGLVDVKFLLTNRNEASFSEVCADLLAFEAAIADGKIERSDFGDLSLK